MIRYILPRTLTPWGRHVASQTLHPQLDSFSCAPPVFLPYPTPISRCFPSLRRTLFKIPIALQKVNRLSQSLSMRMSPFCFHCSTGSLEVDSQDQRENKCILVCLFSSVFYGAARAQPYQKLQDSLGKLTPLAILLCFVSSVSHSHSVASTCTASISGIPPWHSLQSSHFEGTLVFPPKKLK